jgi:Spy/CpxP family protein refolding chaperone
MNMKRMAVIVLALVFSLTTMGTVLAGERGQGRDDRGRGHHGKAGHHGRGGHGPLGMLKRLDLTQEQKQNIAEVVKKYRADMEKNAAEMFEAKKGLMSVTSADSFDENAVEKAAGAVAEKMAAGMVLRAKAMNEAVQFLTPEQKAKFKEMKSKRAERMSKRAEHGFDNIDAWLEKDTSKNQ